jgi:hypothetical protein
VKRISLCQNPHHLITMWCRNEGSTGANISDLCEYISCLSFDGGYAGQLTNTVCWVCKRHPHPASEREQAGPIGSFARCRHSVS